MDAVIELMQANLTEEIQVKPDRYDHGSDRMCKLNNALYGLKQSGRQWNLMLEKVRKS